MHMGVPVRFICIGFDLRPIRRASRRTKDDLSTVVCLNEARMKSSCKSNHVSASCIGKSGCAVRTHAAALGMHFGERCFYRVGV
jgi:hypothetical protein